MVQIIKEIKKPTTAERFSNAIGAGLNAAKPMMDEYQENQAFKRMGIDSQGFSPDQKQLLLKGDIEQKNQNYKFGQEQEFDNKNYGNVEKIFGKTFADAWKAAPQGGKTELIKHGLDALSRGENLNELLGNIEPNEFQEEQPNPTEQTGLESEQEAPKIPQVKNGKVSSKLEWPDFSKRPKGYTPKGWDSERKSWRKENAPIFEANKTRVQANSRDELGIKNLNKLNESRNVGEGFERILINPETGEFYGSAQLGNLVSPEAQEWVKEIARFQNRAKDAFGSRVTNFDLQSYMKQFPGLLNTYDGRKRILQMMGINNKLDQLYDKTLQQVYQKYGLSGISQEEADKLATSMIQDETEKLRYEYLGMDAENQKQNQTKDSNLSGKMVDVLGPDGQMYEVDEREVESLPQGFRIQ